MITFRQKINDIESRGLNVRIDQCGIIEFREVDYHLLRPEGSGDYQLIYVVGGTGYFHFDKSVSEAKAGSAVLYAPGQAQEYAYSENGGALVYFCHFSGDGVDCLLGDLPIPTERVLDVGTELTERFDTLLKSNSAVGEASAALALLKLLEYISHKLHARVDEKSDPIEAALADIRENYMLERSVEEYAALCHFSKYHFLRKFKERTGVTPIAYRNEYRISIAERLLCDSNLSVDSVAAAVGFSSATYFFRLYKRSRGCSPRMYCAKQQCNT